jgi:hypothetical protein
MLPIILLTAFLLQTQEASMTCVDTGAKIATTQTQQVQGPGGVGAVLRVSSADDHSKNSHDCSADYQLVVGGGAGAPKVVDLLTSDGDYNRTMTLRLFGFSQDGKRVFGIFSEGGKYPSTALFDYPTADGSVQLIDLRQQFGNSSLAKCGSAFEVIGTAGTDGIVLELSSSSQCPTGRWLLDAKSDKPQRLSQNASIQNLYHP